MKMKLAFAAGMAAGYVLGSRSGRKSYEQLKTSISSFWTRDSVQEVVTSLEQDAKEATENLGHKVKDLTAPSAAPDVTSDPALNDEPGNNWEDEGGAGLRGPVKS